MMYLDHFGLRELPFRLTPLTEFFFSGARRGATVDALVYAILHEEGIVKVSGEVGAGKTMLCRVLIERLPEKVDTVYFANPTLEPEDLLRTIAHELGLSLPHRSAGTLLGGIQDELIKRHGDGRRVVALIDEAHAMPRASLEQIRLLSNLETGRHKLLQIVLFGQPELDSMLDAHAMRPLKDRITHHFRLDPFSTDEVTDYLEFRMRAAGFRGPTVFSPASARKIARYASGLTRRINVLADKALLAAYAENLYAVNPSHVKTAARDAQYLPRGTRRPGWLVIPVAFLLSAFLAWQAFSHLAPNPNTGAARRSAHPSVDTAPDDNAHPPGNDPAPVSQTEPASPATDPNPRLEQGNEAATPDSAYPPTDATGARGLAGRSDDSLGTTASAVANAESALSDWLPGTDDQTWFIQLHTNTNATEAQLQTQVEQAASALRQPIRVYRARVAAGERTGVIIGDYRSERDAQAALTALPDSYRSGGAYVRQARHLK